MRRPNKIHMALSAWLGRWCRPSSNRWSAESEVCLWWCLGWWLGHGGLDDARDDGVMDPCGGARAGS
jgi:hypothetical protein